ncbi:WbqC family protein [Streptomyces sp. NBC_00306]|uniref:WbqC family protein n=1 Tax=Streptomyces sp. NBC_00306 TaxID=2975708 RepID=UPI002E29A984|nr:WbqC family protein [Streptomyces sp. NBC_00306]
MIISAHQPAYLPWLGYFAKIARADLFVLHDRSRIGRRNMLNRNTIGGPRDLLLTIPLAHEDLRAERPIDEVHLVDDGWRRRHWKAVQMAYRRAPHFRTHAEFLESYYATEFTTLNEVCLPFIDYCLEQLKIDTPVHRISQLDLPAFDRQTIIPLLCERFGADAFIAGPQAVNYLKTDGLEGIRIDYFHYAHPVYPQAGNSFHSHLSVLDLLMNCGPESADIVRGTPA